MKSLKFAAFFFMASFMTSMAVTFIPPSQVQQIQENLPITERDGVLHHNNVRAQLDNLMVLEMDADAATAYVESLNWTQ